MDIITIVSFLGDLCILYLTIYTCYKTFWCSRIGISSFGIKGERTGDKITLLLNNRGNKTIAIQKIKCIFENKYIVTIGSWSDPLILNPLSALKVESEEFSYLENYSLSQMMGQKFYAEIETCNGKIYSKFRKRFIGKKKKKLTQISVIRNEYNGLIVPQYAKYALTYLKEDVLVTSFILKEGAMTEEVYYYNEETKQIDFFNGLQKNLINNEKVLKEFFSKVFKPSQTKWNLEKLSQYGVNSNA